MPKYSRKKGTPQVVPPLLVEEESGVSVRDCGVASHLGFGDLTQFRK